MDLGIAFLRISVPQTRMGRNRTSDRLLQRQVLYQHELPSDTLILPLEVSPIPFKRRLVTSQGLKNCVANLRISTRFILAGFEPARLLGTSLFILRDLRVRPPGFEPRPTGLKVQGAATYARDARLTAVYHGQDFLSTIPTGGHTQDQLSCRRSCRFLLHLALHSVRSKLDIHA